VAVNPVTDTVYTANEGAGTVSVIDGVTALPPGRWPRVRARRHLPAEQRPAEREPDLIHLTAGAILKELVDSEGHGDVGRIACVQGMPGPGGHLDARTTSPDRATPGRMAFAGHDAPHDRYAAAHP
jgi:hypothetical protein